MKENEPRRDFKPVRLNGAPMFSRESTFHLQSALDKFCELDLHFELFRIEIAQGLSLVHLVLSVHIGERGGSDCDLKRVHFRSVFYGTENY